MSTVGLFAHASVEEAEETARDAIALAVALMTGDHRLLLHIPGNLAIPLMLAGELARAPVVLEGAERRPHPMVMMPGPRPEGPEAAIFARVEIGTSERGPDVGHGEPLKASFMDRFEALGIVDTSWMRDREPDMDIILEREAPAAIVAMGWSSEVKSAVAAAERYARAHKRPLLIAGARRGPMANASEWDDLDRFVDFSHPKIEFPLDEDVTYSEEFVAAWALAQRRAAVVLAAETLAGLMQKPQ